MSAQAKMIHTCEAVSDDAIDLELAQTIGMELAARITPTVIPKMPLAACLDRVLAQDIVAPRPLPAFNTAAMDGFAIRCSDLSRGTPYRLRVTRSLRAGGDTDIVPTHVPGSALRIMTGAAVPPYCDAVIPLEDATECAGLIEFTRSPDLFANIRREGAVARKGDVLLEAGRCLNARDIALLAATGHGHVAIRRKVPVAVVSSGAELVESDEVPTGSQINDSNRPMLLANMSRPWLAIRDLGIVQDDYAMLAQMLDVAAEDTRIIVTTGGASHGDADCLRTAINHLGGEIVVSGIAMKPGKPTLIARLRDTIIIGLSGNPVAAHVGMQVMGWPILRVAAGLDQRKPPRRPGIANFSYTPRPGRSEFPLISTSGYDAHGCALLDMPAKFDAAGLVRLAHFDGFAMIESGARKIEPGDSVMWSPF